jgi:hypothetical protein
MDFYARGIQAFEQGRARTARNRLAELSSAALSAPVEQRGQFASQIAAIDPDAGFSFDQGIQRQQQAMQAESERRLGNMAKLLSVAPPEARGGLYARIAPGLRDMGYEAPEAWSDDMMPVVQQLAGGQQEGRTTVVAPGSVLAGPNGEVLFRNDFKPQPEDRGTLVDVPVPGGTEKMLWRNGRLEPLPFGGSHPPSPRRSFEVAPAQGGMAGADPAAALSAMTEGGTFVIGADGRPQQVGRPGVDMSGPGAPPPAGRPGFRPDSKERLATPDEKRLYGYAESDIVAIDANGLPKPIRVAEAPGAKPVSAETANKVSLYDNALRAARQWQRLVVNPDGTFNDIASRTPQAKALLDQALRAKLRAESGASISQEEIEGETGRYRGGWMSSDSTAVQQANALVDDLTNQRAALDPASQVQPAIPGAAPSAPAPAAQAPAGGIRIISVTPAGQR